MGLISGEEFKKCSNWYPCSFKDAFFHKIKPELLEQSHMLSGYGIGVSGDFFSRCPV
jgi:hypothetical protein